MRVALGVEYDGSCYFGWQRQKEVDTVQQNIERALSKVADEKITIHCAGRTDAGVHATGQVIHFDTTSARDMKAWTLGVNANLPSQISIRWAQEVKEDFHARFSATARRYRYVIYNSSTRPALFQASLTHYVQPLDEHKMHRAAQALLGEQDFTSFRASQCQSNTPFRCVQEVKVVRIDNYVIVEIMANAFLHHMVRNIVGSLLEIGVGEQEENWIAQLLLKKDRSLAAPTAKAHGLFLVDVTYPEHFNIQKNHKGPLFLPETLI